MIARSAPADVVTDWNDTLLSVIRSTNTSPPQASRALAMTHAAIFNAVNTIDPQYQPYHVQATAPANTDATAAASQAALRVLASLYPQQQTVFAARFGQEIASVTDPIAKANGIALGNSVAEQILAWRANDHSTDQVTFTPGTGPGQWQPTPPGYAAGVLPQWATVTPFTMQTCAQFRPAGPPPLNSPDYQASYDDVKAYGAANSPVRTADQTQIARFWADGTNTVTPPGHWNQIAQDIAAQKHNTVAQNARLFAVLNGALADAGIAAWDCKYAFAFWRPITAIQDADTDGNPLTAADTTWTPLLPTPAFPENISGHSTFSGAAAEVLKLFYGSDDFAFTTGSDALPGVTRSFDSFSQAAYEAGRSRIYGGIHFEFSNEQGLTAGASIGDYAFANAFVPVPEPGMVVIPLGAAVLLGRRRRS